MAVDWSLVKKHDDFNVSPVTNPITPRRSPRLALIRSTSTATSVPAAVMDVFVFEVLHAKQNEPKISKTSILLQGVNEECTLPVLKEQLRAFDGSQNLFVPASGLFWLRKGSKQMVQLKTEKDLAFCKDEYRDKVKGRVNSIRVACAVVSVENLGASSSTVKNPKRSLEFRTGDGRDLELVAAASAAEGMASKKIKAGENDLWNEVHCALVRDLEKKGIVNRYGVKHLKLWTDQIIEGKSAGVGEEPKWENYIDQVGIPPKPPARQSPQGEMASKQTTATTDDLLKAMIIQNQQRMDLESKRAETFQNSLLALIANKSNPDQSLMSPWMQTSTQPFEERKSPITQYTLAKCCNFLEEHKLEMLIPQFVQAEMDGPLLVSLCNPHINNSILEGMGIINTCDKEALIKAVTEKMSGRDP